MNTIATFLKETLEELKKVNWPSKRQITNYTAVVIGASIVVAIFLGVLDTFFSKLIEQFIF